MHHNEQTHTFRDGTQLTMMQNSILVKPDVPKDRTTSGLIHYPGGSMESVINKGTILAYGYIVTKRGIAVPIPGLAIGLRCCFVRFIADQDSNKQLRERLPDDCIRIRAADILVVFDAEDEEHVE